MTNKKSLEPYTGPAGGWDALAATGAIGRSQGAPAISARALIQKFSPHGSYQSFNERVR